MFKREVFNSPPHSPILLSEGTARGRARRSHEFISRIACILFATLYLVQATFHLAIAMLLGLFRPSCLFTENSTKTKTVLEIAEWNVVRSGAASN